ncbi:MAG: type II toxin-antitoxin system VapC family toxin [Vulcanimicrobiota bacterium]
MNSFVVIDASFTLRAVLTNPLAEKARSKLGEWDRASLRLRSPGLWYYEVASALSKLVRFKELSWEQARTAMKLALDLQVELVTPDSTDYRAVWQWTEQLQRAAPYDSPMDCRQAALQRRGSTLGSPFGGRDEGLISIDEQKFEPRRNSISRA